VEEEHLSSFDGTKNLHAIGGRKRKKEGNPKSHRKKKQVPKSGMMLSARKAETEKFMLMYRQVERRRH